MDYSNERPKRYWITNPDAHPAITQCEVCREDLDRTHSIPVNSELGGGLCQKDATEDVHDHPLTTTYIEWLNTGDPRWWSSWCCNCKGCVPNEESAA